MWGLFKNSWKVALAAARGDGAAGATETEHSGEPL